MSQKHIFIGLGGAGVNTVSQIKYKIYQKQQTGSGKKSRLDAMNETYRFLFIDTDARDLESYNKKYADTFENGRVKFIDPQTDLVSLSKGNPQQIYNEAAANPTPLINQRILEACSPELAARIPDQPLKFGAGAFRMKSRISFARSLSEFQQKLQAHIEALNSVKNTGGDENTIFYWVVCSTNGGTGSGIINDVLYYVNMQHKRSIGDGDPHLVLTQYMPKFYIDKNSTEEKYSLNAFAVFTEIEAFKALSMDEKRNKVFHRLAFSKDYNLINSEVRYDPFYYLIPIDCQTDNGTNIGDGMYSNTAEMLYYIHDGNGGSALHSDVDNYMHDLYNERPKGFLVPMGYIALRKPEEDFRNYMSARLRFDMLTYGLYNKGCKKASDDEMKDFLADALKSGFDKKATESKENIISEYLNEDIIKDDEKTKLKIDGDDGFNESKGAECVSMFDAQMNAYLKEEKDKCIDDINAKFWEKAEKAIIEHGVEYAADLYKRMVEEAKNRLKELTSTEKTKNFEAICDDNGVATVKEGAMKYSITEHFNQDAQRKEVENFFSLVKSSAEEAIDSKINQLTAGLLVEFISENGEAGKLYELKEHLDKLLKSVQDLAADADKQYTKLAITLNEKGLDVTSVYLPDMKTVCDGNGWIKGNFFSRYYEMMFKPSQDAVDGKDNKPMRNGEKSIQKFLEDELYSKNGEFYKDIVKDNCVVKDNVRFLVNENFLTATCSSMIERFLSYSQRIFEKRIEKDPQIREKWYNKPISKFFEELDNAEKDRVRSSLRPSLFFNYKENRIAVDYREFLIFVAPDPDLATLMLGYQPGNPNHRCITSTETGAAFVIRAKYGLSFSDYRLYDTLKERYEAAKFREKYHFHKFFADYGEKILLEDLPYEISPAHRIFTKIYFLSKFGQYFDGFFFEPEYLSQKEDYANSILKMNINEKGDFGVFSIARPKAVTERGPHICIQVKDKNTNLFADFEGNDFIESFASYQKEFIRDSIADTYDKFLVAVTRHKQASEELNKEISGERIINEHFTEVRKALLKELDEKAFKAVRDVEKSIYSIMFQIVDKEIVYPKDL